MLKLKDIKMKPKLIGFFLLAGIIPLLVIGILSANLAKNALLQKTFDQLQAIRDIKKTQIERLFHGQITEGKLMVESNDAVTTYNDMRKYHNDSGVQGDATFPVDTEEYNRLWKKNVNIKRFMEESGFYDIFLICAKHGHVMYTAEKKSDLGTNLGYGPYKNSLLAKMWRKVVQTRDVVITDVEPYALNNNAPSAFFGIPLIENGTMKGVFAFQISSQSINKVMQERSGMGRTGETYLVGQDYLMRSDSFLDPVNHSVAASFKNPEKGKIDSYGVKEALSGKTGYDIFIDYNGNSVFSAYTQIKIGDFTWAILAEIDEAEVMEPINSLVKNIIIAAIIIAVILAIAALIIGNMIVNPIIKGVKFAELTAEGDLTAELDIDQKDEIGLLGNALRLMSDNLQNMVKDISDTTSTLSGASEELTSISSEMSSAVQQMNAQSDTVAAASEQVSVSVETVAAASEQSSSSVSSIANMTEEMSSTFNEIVGFAKTTSTNVQEMADASEEVSMGINSTASAIEEMTISLNEVASNTSKASQVSTEAKQGAEDINVKMNTLVTASKQIGKIIGVIKDIADQTNMLALNATIEAAGAGEAGKGFAVVAGEVKELAKQSADATDEIASQVEEIQSSTNEVVTAIDEISKIINNISDITDITVTTVEEQTTTAGEISKTISENALTVQDIAKKSAESATLVKEIAKSTDESSKTAGEVARHVSELSAGINEVARSSSEASRGVQDVTKNINEISAASNDAAKRATQTNESALELAKLAGILFEIVGKFKV